MTAIFFSLGQFALGLYLRLGNVGSAFGATGSLVIVLVWIYYSAQIFFFGAEFTQVYTNTYGYVEPAANAEFVTEDSVHRKALPTRTRQARRKVQHARARSRSEG